jgi:hypothetical protein
MAFDRRTTLFGFRALALLVATLLSSLWPATFPVLVAQQAPVPARTAASVRALPPFANRAASAAQTELIISWAVSAGTPGILTVPGAARELHQFQVRARTPVSDPPVRERDPQIAEDDLVIVALDPQGREIGWQHLKDPRIVRSEQPGPDGLLTGQVLHRSDAEFVVRMPDSLPAVSLRVYEPQWNGTEFMLRELGTVVLR